MSRRPRGPSDRPFYDPESLDDGEAPRLPTQSFLSRLVMGSLLLFCCGVIAMSGLFVVSFFAQLPHNIAPSASVVGPGAAVVSIEHHEMRRPRRQQRSVLQRLSMLRRAQAPSRGVDEASMRAIFPHWVASDGGLSHPAVLSDLILALSYLAQEELGEYPGS